MSDRVRQSEESLYVNDVGRYTSVLLMFEVRIINEINKPRDWREMSINYRFIS